MRGGNATQSPESAMKMLKKATGIARGVDQARKEGEERLVPDHGKRAVERPSTEGCVQSNAREASMQQEDRKEGVMQWREGQSCWRQEQARAEIGGGEGIPDFVNMQQVKEGRCEALDALQPEAR